MKKKKINKSSNKEKIDKGAEKYERVEDFDEAWDQAIILNKYLIELKRVEMMKLLNLDEGLSHHKFLILFNRKKRVDSIGNEYGWFLSKREIWAGRKLYMRRTYLLPANNYFNLYLHEWHSSDDLNTTHNHPWNSLSVVLRGNLIEWLDEKTKNNLKKWDWSFRKADFFHAIELPDNQKKAPLTLFMTGPVISKNWVFRCLNSGKIIPNKEYTNRDGAACSD